MGGGAPLGTQYIKAFRSWGIEILNGYGTTECSPCIVVNRNRYHKDGFITLTGRKKNLIILSNGENISPEELEADFLKDMAVSEIFVKERDGLLATEIYPDKSYLAEIHKDGDRTADLGLSSLDVISVVVAFEDEFGIEIPDEKIYEFATVGDIVGYLEEE